MNRCAVRQGRGSAKRLLAAPHRPFIGKHNEIERLTTVPIRHRLCTEPDHLHASIISLDANVLSGDGTPSIDDLSEDGAQLEPQSPTCHGDDLSAWQARRCLEVLARAPRKKDDIPVAANHDMGWREVFNDLRLDGLT